MKALVKLEVECDVDDVNGEGEYVWVKIPKEVRGRRYMVHKSKVTYPKEEQQRLKVEDGEMEKHIYVVGMMSDEVKIEAPNAKAAALFYGLHTGGNMQLGAAVYSEDGKESKEEDRLPFAKYQFDFAPNKEKESELENELKAIAPLLKECRIIENEEDEGRLK